MQQELLEKGKGRRTFALVVRGYPEDFAGLVEQAKIYGFYVVFTKSSTQRLVIEEVSW
jgi:hypothetical protein